MNSLVSGCWLLAGQMSLLERTLFKELGTPNALRVIQYNPNTYNPICFLGFAYQLLTYDGPDVTFLVQPVRGRAVQ